MLSTKNLYSISEKFKSLQGEGVYAGTSMAFIRFAGCSVGKTVCHFCDTDFEERHSFRGGGKFSAAELADWTYGHKHVCLTGGEPLNQDLSALWNRLLDQEQMVHIETSGTLHIPKWAEHHRCWVTVSPKPGWTPEAVARADEIKIIVPGLGERFDYTTNGWPGLKQALDWAKTERPVFLQPRNGKFDIDKVNLKYCIDAIADHPELRLSVQMHKILGVQ
jgi:7-carboxy-7-deazaguanine synthase